MMVIRLVVVFIFTVLLTGCDDIKKLKDDADALREDIKVLKADIKLFRSYLTATQVPGQCPHPGEHAPMICHYTLKIKGPYEPDKHKGWFTATVPEQVVKRGKDDCEKVKASNPDYANLDCIDPKMYPYMEYVIYVEGKTVEKDEIWHFVNNPITNHLIAKEKVQLPNT